MSKTEPSYKRIVGDFENLEELKQRVERLARQGKKAVLVAYSDP